MDTLGVFIKVEMTDDNESTYKSDIDTFEEDTEENDSCTPTILIKQEMEEEKDEEEEEPNIHSDTKRETKDFLKMEAELRIARINKQRLYNKELHALRIKEAKVKLQMAEAELEILRLRKELLLKDSNKI